MFSFIFYFFNNASTTHFYTHFFTIIQCSKLWMMKKMMDLCDSDRWPIIICHIGQLWENVWYNTSVFNFLKILIIIFPFLNYQFSVLFLLLSHITHLLFFFLFHHALYISNSRDSHVIFLIFFLFLFYLPFLTSSPCFFILFYLFI